MKYTKISSLIYFNHYKIKKSIYSHWFFILNVDDDERICLRVSCKWCAVSIRAFRDDGVWQCVSIERHDWSIKVNFSIILSKLSLVKSCRSSEATSVFLTETLNNNSMICIYVLVKCFFACSSFDRIDWATPLIIKQKFFYEKKIINLINTYC